MATARSILIVDDDRAMRELLASLYREQSYETAEAASVDEALELAADRDFDVVVSDIRMPGRSGVELIGALRRLRRTTPVILMTAFGSIDSAVEAMRAGAFDYITKPFEPEAVAFAAERALQQRRLEEENERLRRAVDKTAAMGDLLGESPAMREIFAMIRKVGATRSSVLITGESGTGKDLVARTIHYQGDLKDQPYVPINCTAIPEGLLESELFGHVRGAFTGAHASKRGLFEEANGGTLFLDEIGDLPLSLQAKLLRVLQDREIRPVGSNRTVQVQVRIIAATHRDLDQEIEAGRFREDLFYRLNVIPIHVPPLRERREDIPVLVRAFLRKHAPGGKGSISDEALDWLCAQRWRGNARELENVVERTLALADGPDVGLADLPMGKPEAGGALSPETFLKAAAARRTSLQELEDQYLKAVLESVGGNKLQASKILGIDRKTLYRRTERLARAAS